MDPPRHRDHRRGRDHLVAGAADRLGRRQAAGACGAPPDSIVVGAGWGGVNFLRRYRAKRQPGHGRGPGERPAVQRGRRDEENAALKEHFEAAVAVLKKTRVKGTFGGQFLYELPRNITIGPPGSGKTTALLNSGLEFPLAERHGGEPVAASAVRVTVTGGLPMKRCWWIPPGAIPARTVTVRGRRGVEGLSRPAEKIPPAPPHQRHPGRRPDAGPDDQSAAERERHSPTVRHRIKELYELLGAKVPVYVMFTKTDLVAGFMEFFDDLSREQRAQVWGMTFGEDAGHRSGPAMTSPGIMSNSWTASTSA